MTPDFLTNVVGKPTGRPSPLCAAHFTPKTMLLIFLLPEILFKRLMRKGRANKIEALFIERVLSARPQKRPQAQPRHRNL